MWNDVKRSWRETFRLAGTWPWLFGLPVVMEAGQHLIEYRAGMFDSFDGMRAAGDDSSRMMFGELKVLALMLLVFWVCRALAFGGRRDRPVLGDGPSLLLFAPVLALGFVTGLSQQYGGGLLAPYVPQGMLTWIGLAWFALLFSVDIMLIGWKVGASLGNAELGPIASFRLMHGRFWWTLGLVLTVTIPPMVLHYAFNFLAVGRPPALQAAILIADALLVGLLGIVMAVATYIAASRAAERRGISLEGETIGVREPAR